MGLVLDVENLGAEGVYTVKTWRGPLGTFEPDPTRTTLCLIRKLIVERPSSPTSAFAALFDRLLVWSRFQADPDQLDEVMTVLHDSEGLPELPSEACRVCLAPNGLVNLWLWSQPDLDRLNSDHPNSPREEASQMSASAVYVETELERVERWRLEELERAGYEPSVSAVLATSPEVDLHFAIELLSKGCPPPLALRILQPLAA